MPQTSETIRLNQETLLAFAEYIGKAEAGMERSLHDGPFLWSDACAERDRQVHNGKILAAFWSGDDPSKVPDGLVHDWIGAVNIAGTTIAQTLALIQDYDNHKNIYKSEVLDSKLVHHRGNYFQIYLRLLKKKILTVVLDTDHDVHYSAVDSARWCCRSYTTRIAEVEDFGRPAERVLPADAGYGFLWRLFTYWRFHERNGGVDVECRAISLSRDVPMGLGWLIEPIIRKLPRESLVNTLDATRRALAQRRQ